VSLPPLATAARPASRRATGTRNGEQDTLSRPAWWKKCTESGSPPCSPQNPITRPGRAARPFLTASSMSCPTPSRSIDSNRRNGEARRHRQAEIRHLGEVGTLAAKKILEVLVALSEVIHELQHCKLPE
jgi:hypothetical protein